MAVEGGATLKTSNISYKHKPEGLLISCERAPPSVCPPDTHLDVPQSQVPLGKPGTIVKSLYFMQDSVTDMVVSNIKAQ